MTPFQCDRILVPTDLSPLADSAIRYAHGLAELCKAELHVLHVARDEAERLLLPAGVTGAGPDADATGSLAQILGEPGGVRRVEAVRVAADVPDAIRKHAYDAAVHIVMSTLGRSGLREVLVGSVAHELVRTARCPVLLVRAWDGR